MIRCLIRRNKHFTGSDFLPVLTHVITKPGVVTLDDTIHIDTGESFGICHPDENRGGSRLQFDLSLSAVFLLIPWLCSYNDRNISQRMDPESSSFCRHFFFEADHRFRGIKLPDYRFRVAILLSSCMKDHIVVTFKFSVSPNPLAHMCTSPFLVSGRLPAFFLHPKTLLQTAACGLRRRNFLPQVFVTGAVSHCLIIRI